jgi:hypothetical protein
MRPLTAEQRVAHWPNRVVSAQDLERLGKDIASLVLLPNAIVTPAAHDWLRAHGVSVTMQSKSGEAAKATGWRWAMERPFAVVMSVLESLRKEGLTLSQSGEPMTSVADWARSLAGELELDYCRGMVAFTSEPAVASCVANKSSRIRAAAVGTVAHAERAVRGLGANWLAVEMPGRSFFELRQIVRIAAKSSGECPADVAKVLTEMKAGGCRCESRK